MPDRKLHLLVHWGLIAGGIALVAVTILNLWDRHPEKTSANTLNQSGLTHEEFLSWLNKSYNSLSWNAYQVAPRLDRSMLEQSLDSGLYFICNNQRLEGNFNYEYDFIKRQISTDDNQVRQAGALWGLALIYQHTHDATAREALDKGLDYLFAHTRDGPVQGSLFIAYSDPSECRTGTVALAALAIIEYLRIADTGSVQIEPERRKRLKYHLGGYLRFLEYMNLGNGNFAESYAAETGARINRSNPYYNGEALLCLIKAAKYLGHTELMPLIDDAALR